MVASITELPPIVAGEIPDPFEYVFLDDDGITPRDLSGFTAKLSYRVAAGTPTVRDAEVTDANDGVVAYEWRAGDSDEAGVMRGELVVGDGDKRYARRFVRWIRNPGGGPLPEPGEGGVAGDYVTVDDNFVSLGGDVVVFS